jgi:hypothetical protein
VVGDFVTFPSLEHFLHQKSSVPRDFTFVELYAIVLQLATNEIVGIARVQFSTSFGSNLGQEHAPERGTINSFHAAGLCIKPAKSTGEAIPCNVIIVIGRHDDKWDLITVSDERAVAEWFGFC